MLTLLTWGAVALLAFANGANDNFKGVATLFGSGTTNYRRALWWGTWTTLSGSVFSIHFAGVLLKRFSGKGLIADAALADPRFAVSVVAAAGLTVLSATRLGLPISTTHALVGAMAGTALAGTAPVSWDGLGQKFLAPLIASPLAALVVTASIYFTLRRFSTPIGLRRNSCVCIGQAVPECSAVLATASAMGALPDLGPPARLAVTYGMEPKCRERFVGATLGLSAERLLNASHFLSAGVVGFARGLNDTPKIAALLLIAPAAETDVSLLICGLIIAAGGIISARRVAETMSHRITTMNPGQGFIANLVTGVLVIGASRFGLPVSTTHVSCGSLFGIGLSRGPARRGLITQVLTAWVATLPLALSLGWVIHRLLLLPWGQE